MKRIIIGLLLGLILTGMGGCLYLQRIVINGDDEILHAIRSIRPGMSASEVKAHMKQEPQVLNATSLPSWIKEAVPERDAGEYWYFYMSFPPRNLIIYIGADQKVGYVTWHPT